MKKRLFAFIFALAMYIALNPGAVYGQSDQAIRVEIPFAFSARNSTLPKGTYSITPASDGRLIWRIQGNDEPGQFLLAGSLSGRRTHGDLKLTFHRYGDRHFLVGFTTPSYQVSLPRSNGEKALLSGMGKFPRMDVIHIETVAEISR